MNELLKIPWNMFKIHKQEKTNKCENVIMLFIIRLHLHNARY